MHTSSEWEAFGPWIDKVRAVDDLPWLYRNAGIDPADYRLVLKVPRNITRRDATPDMHLYDRLLAVGQEALTILSRSGNTYTTAHVPFDQIVAIEDSVAMLDGRLTLHTVGGRSVAIPYNGAAVASVRDLIGLLRQLYLPASADAMPLATGSTPLAPGSDPDRDAPDLGVKDIGLASAYHTVARAEPQVRVVSSTTRRVVTPTSGTLSRLLHVMWPVTLQASITVADDREVQVIHRRRWFTRGSDEAVHSLARTILPLTRISAVQVRPHDRYERMRLVDVHAGATCLRFPAPAGPDADAAFALFAPSHTVCST